MIYNLDIKEHNQQVHTDIEHDMQKQGNGLFTFILRVDNGNVVDYNVVEYADARKYLVLKKIIISEFTVTSHSPNGNQSDPVRSNNGEREPTRGDSATGHDKHSEVKKEEVSFA